MSYDPNSPQAHKGKLGEQIVKLILDDWGADVKRPDNASENSPTLIDFHATPKPGEQFHERLIEVKVRKAMPYAFGQCPCYAFPVAQLEAYKSSSDERGLDCELWIVDPDEGEIYIGSLGGNLGCIEEKCFIDGREFPFDMQTKRGLMRFYHREQFDDGYDLSENCPDELSTVKATETSTVKPTETSTKMSAKDLLEHLANVVGLSANDVVEAVLEMRQIRFDEQQDRLKALFGGTKHD